MYDNIKELILAIVTALFGVTLFDALFNLKSIIAPGISLIYNALGPNIAPNMVTNIVFDWRGYDTLGEALILVSAVLIVLLIFGRGKLKGDEQ
ncbi:MAG: EhbH [Methanobacteriaceae archaeon]|jgi:energy-converting hydrogenase B subunit H|uniref:EhbH n=1 Tax=Methanobrevibacter TaxID=2172 RepID=UPI0037591BDC|nr:EhbH [Methanobacteriaceae archaeon]MDD4594155.1 EhbH [Methanobacteriaceae archaeon]